MKLIKPCVSLIEETNPIKKVELIGRTCYKSENKITNDSCIKFVNSLISRSHYAMLEHANVTFEVTGIYDKEIDIVSIPFVGYTYRYFEDEIIRYITVSLSHLVKWSKYMYTLDELSNQIFAFMYRCFESTYGKIDPKFDINRWPTLSLYSGIEVRMLTNSDKDECFNEEDKDIHTYATVKFVCDRGVSHELVRHRCAVAQESTRYCNYGAEKFGNEIQYVEPAKFNDSAVWTEDTKQSFIHCLEVCESTYMKMIKDFNMTPQQARAVLPNALKTEVILTMPRWQWKHFINLRSIGTTGQPHPDMKVVADEVHDILKERKFI